MRNINKAGAHKGRAFYMTSIYLMKLSFTLFNKSEKVSKRQIEACTKARKLSGDLVDYMIVQILKRKDIKALKIIDAWWDEVS